ncbi:hypothetical protein CVT24_009316 [Panaeolus cyanescens]|uniref:ATP-dependent DNA helicase n=1 Tax=Panaeolus cyanescens TaxID=181874 RepID=A0A409WTN9_9AGAR|nr:hypothetical protein CVT24_009316 [Panaeolus cyanescens]
MHIIKRFLKRSAFNQMQDALSVEIQRWKEFVVQALPRSNNLSRLSPRPVSDTERSPISNEWPPRVSSSDVQSCLSSFQHAVSRDSLSSDVCGSCARRCLKTDLVNRRPASLNMDCFSSPRNRVQRGSDCVVDDVYPDFAMTFEPSLPDYPYALLHPSGVHHDAESSYLSLCAECVACVDRGSVPPLSLANHNFIGEVPEELRDLNMIEECMIAPCRAKTTVVQLTEIEGRQAASVAQRALKGNVIIFPQDPSQIARSLPIPPHDMAKHVCIVFIGSSKPSREWILTKAKPLLIRPDVIRRALIWLKRHNPLYRDILIDFQLLTTLPAETKLPVDIHRYDNVASFVKFTSDYDPSSNVRTNDPVFEDNITFERTCIPEGTDLTSPSQMRTAAAVHLKNGGSFLPIAHGDQPSNEFVNPSLFPRIYPTLYPYGVGGFENSMRSVPLSMDRQIVSLLNFADNRFQVHYSFMFTAFNILQRRRVLLYTHNRVQNKNFRNFARNFSSVSAEAMATYAENYRQSGHPTDPSDEERLISRLLNEINIITRDIPGTPASKKKLRNELRALILEKGLPSFFITLNPADIYNPILSFLSGRHIDPDHMSANDLPQYFEQACFIANNPVVTAKFFDLYMKAFFEHLLKFTSDMERSENGILGKTSAYYGCVEAQGRGSLHCHMMVWLDGSLEPSALKKRILDDDRFREEFVHYLESVIWTDVPSDPLQGQQTLYSTQHPCKLRPPDASLFNAQRNLFHHDLHYLVEACQRHVHTDTCFKYSNGSRSESDCRFNLGAQSAQPFTIIIEETGEIKLKHVDGTINNFNPIFLCAMRCNMDIKFIGSGTCAKALLYYITDYITKSPLKAHVAFSALETAIDRIGRLNEDLSVLFDPSKVLLHKSAFSLLSRQELSAQQVAMALLKLNDHYTSHRFRTFYWLELLNRTFSNDANEIDNLFDDSPDTEHGDEVHTDPNEYDVEVDADDDGVVFKKASFLDDYRYRSERLADICLWEFIAQYARVRKTAPASTERPRNSSTNIFYNFKDGHPQQSTCRMKRLPSESHVVPVPVGKMLPRNDRPSSYSEYCSVMLLLFKPWSDPGEMSAFRHNAQHIFSLLHECKDSKDDDYFSKRRNIPHADNNFFVSENQPTHMATTDDLTIEDVQQQLAVEHLQQLFNCRSDYDNIRHSQTSKILTAAQDASLFPFTDQEDTWNAEYTRRRKNWRQCAVQLLDNQRNDANNSAQYDQSVNWASIHEVSNCKPISLADGLTTCRGMFTCAVHSPKPLTRLTHLAHQISSKFKLNEKQCMAFELICRAVQGELGHENPDQLRMALIGAGGTGKSTVIHAISELFSLLDRDFMLKKCAYTGVASNNIRGITLHSALGLSRTSFEKNTKMHREIAALWEDTKFLIVDEVSMLGCQNMYKMSSALCAAKNCDKPFGGLHILFAGDFAQLSPIMEKSLFDHLDTTPNSTETAQRNVFGKLLWYSISTVIELSEVMRQCSTEEKTFLSLLHRL